MPQYYFFPGEGMPFYEPQWQAGRPVMPPTRSAVARSLGNADWLESSAPLFRRYPPTRPMMVRSLGDWPPVRPSGPEPLDPGETPTWQSHPMEVGALSDMERSALGIAALVAVGYLAMKALK